VLPRKIEICWLSAQADLSEVMNLAYQEAGTDGRLLPLRTCRSHST
jgi:hypothetical protein